MDHVQGHRRLTQVFKNVNECYRIKVFVIIITVFQWTQFQFDAVDPCRPLSGTTRDFDPECFDVPMFTQ